MESRVTMDTQAAIGAAPDVTIPPLPLTLRDSSEDQPSTTGRRRTVIDSARGWQFINVAELWRFRELLYFLVWRDVKVRYKQTALGAAWAILQPALMMVVFTLFFSRVANISSGPIPYPLFVYAGLLPWTFFSTAVASASNSVIGSERLITKIYFPRLSIPFAAICAAMVDWGVAMGLLAALMLWYGVLPPLSILLLPLVFGVLALFAAGLGTLLSALNVAYRDFRYVVPFFLQVWMFATPAIYLNTVSGANGDLGVYVLNPLNPLVVSFRAAVLGGPLPWTSLLVAAAIALLTFLGGCLYFRRVEDGFSDII
jgi:lipopolysaccharide transport system permease protein